MIMPRVLVEVTIDREFILKFAATLDNPTHKHRFRVVIEWLFGIGSCTQPCTTAFQYGLQLGFNGF